VLTRSLARFHEHQVRIKGPSQHRERIFPAHYVRRSHLKASAISTVPWSLSLPVSPFSSFSKHLFTTCLPPVPSLIPILPILLIDLLCCPSLQCFQQWRQPPATPRATLKAMCKRKLKFHLKPRCRAKPFKAQYTPHRLCCSPSFLPLSRGRSSSKANPRGPTSAITLAPSTAGPF
jgi:hypothetical protein